MIHLKRLVIGGAIILSVLVASVFITVIIAIIIPFIKEHIAAIISAGLLTFISYNVGKTILPEERDNE